MTNDLIERYIYAVTKRMSSRVREDVSSELRTLIDDMLQERCGEILPSEKDIRVVLTELGDPRELYEQYSSDKKNCLIGPPYYSIYKFVLKIVLPSVALGMFVAGLLTIAADSSPHLFTQLVEWTAATISAMMMSFAFVTVLFAVLYRKDIKITDPYSLDSLPPVPEKKQTISKWECIASIIATLIFLFVFLAVPGVFSFSLGEQGDYAVVNIFNEQALQDRWYILVLFAAVGIARESINLIEGRYNKKVMLTAIAANSLSALLALCWLLPADIINPDLLTQWRLIPQADSALTTALFTNFEHFILAFCLFALVLDTVMTIYKSKQAQNMPS